MYASVRFDPIIIFQRGWTLNSDNFFYYQQEVNKSDDVIPALDLAQQTINYARELEMIV